MPQHRRYDRHAVYLCRPAEGFRPQRAWDYPPIIESATLYKKRLSIADAASFARIHNGEQIKRLQADKQPLTQWAVVVYYLNPRTRKQRQIHWTMMDREGGAA